MKKKVLSLLVLSLFLFYFQSCTNDTISPTNEDSKGKVSLQFKANAPSEVVEINAKLSRNNFTTLTQSIYINDSSNETGILFENIVVGVWNISVEALNIDRIVIYKGQTDITVIPGEIVPVNLQLQPTTGNIFITISWGSDSYFSDYVSNPILTKYNNQYDDKGVAQSAVLQNNNKFMMWYTGLTQNGSYIFYAESNDGLNWNKYSDTPVFFPSENNGWDSRNVVPGTVIFEDGLYKMYYSGRSGVEADAEPWYVGLATSIDGINWERYSEPVLSGSYNSWDLKIGPSSMLKIDNKYYMYYTGKNDIYDHKIGLAISNDGINWEKYSGNPILVPDKDWEGTGIYYPSVIKDNDKYLMVYQNAILNNVSGFGFAYSSDGINWVKDDNNPVFTSKETIANNGNYILYPNIHKINNECRIYYTNYFHNLNDRSICVVRKFVE